MNDYNQTGHFKDKKSVFIPTKLPFFENKKIENVFSGFWHTFIKTKGYKIKK